MSLDARARSAVAELHRAAPHAGETSALLQRIPERVEARRRQHRAVAAVAALLLEATGAGFALGRVAPGGDVQPAGGPTPSPSYTACGSSTVLCQGGRSYRVTLPLPVTFTLPASFQDDGIEDDPYNVQMFNGEDTKGGVTVMETARPVRADGSAAPGAGRTAKEIATWLSTRPFHLPTTVRAAYVGGLEGYRVDVAIRPGAALPGQKADRPAGLTFESNGWTAATSADLHHSSYYVLDAPRDSIVVIWSWTYGGEVSDLVSNAKLIDTISFG